jgi:hypothetical protein
MEANACLRVHLHHINLKLDPTLLVSYPTGQP